MTKGIHLGVAGEKGSQSCIRIRKSVWGRGLGYIRSHSGAQDQGSVSGQETEKVIEHTGLFL